MKKILTLVFILFLAVAHAQISVNAVTCGEHIYYVRVAITQIYIPAHNISTTTCPDGSVHNDTEEGNFVECRMALYQDAACTIPVSVDPRFYSFVRDFPGSTGTANNPSILYRYTCPAPMPIGGIYDNNYRVDYSAIQITQCIWECVGAGYYNCYSTDFGVPVSYGILINCCYAPSVLAVHLVDFNGVRNSGSNTLSWNLDNKQDFVRLELERSFDGVNYTVIYTTGDANISRYADRTENTSYYRLKIYNTNNTSFISPIILLKNLSFLRNNFSVSPSPFGNVLKVSVSAVNNVPSIFKLVSAEGKTVFVAERSLRIGTNNFSFDIPPVAPGMYIMMMSNDEGTVAMKVLKQ